MAHLTGDFESTIDPKGRFLLPAGIKKQFQEGDQLVFWLNRGMEKCINLFPVSHWEPIFAKLSQLDEFEPKDRHFKRYYLSGLTKLEPDSSGKILIPKNLLEHAGIEKDIILVGNINKFEIWDTENYKRSLTAFTPEEYSTMGREVMSGKIDKANGLQ